jgi:transposase-like protein
MADVLCPRCNAKGTVVVKQSKTDKGKELKYFQCTKCRSLWTNSSDIPNLKVEA